MAARLSAQAGISRSSVIALALLAACGRFGFDQTDPVVGNDASSLQDDAAITSDAMRSIAGLVAAWEFETGSGQVVVADVGSGGVLGATIQAEPSDPAWETSTDHVCGGAGLCFDGVDDVATISGPSAANLSAFTVTFSMVAQGPGGNGLARILTKEDGGLPDTIIHFRLADDALAINMFNTADTLFATFAGGVVRNLRSNWAVTFDDAADRRVHVYQDGVEALSYVRQDAMSGTLRTTAQPWLIGNQASRVRGFDGVLDAIHVYDRALAPDEIATISDLCPP